MKKKLLASFLIFVTAATLFGCTGKTNKGARSAAGTNISSGSGSVSGENSTGEVPSSSQSVTVNESNAAGAPGSVRSSGGTASSGNKYSIQSYGTGSTPSSGKTNKNGTQPSEMRAVWISCFELSGSSESAFRSKIGTMFNNAKGCKLNTVIVHVRPCSDAFYKSSIFPWSSYLTGTQGKNPGYDPLAIMVSEAHKRGLSIQAWVNPYRISTNGDKSKISKSNPAYKWLNDRDKVIDLGSRGLFYNPAIPEVQELVIKGVREIVRNYNVDGIQFDDYFYPSTSSSIDKTSYSRYKNSGGRLSLSNWRRENVNSLVSGVYGAVKGTKSNVVFGISPASNISNDIGSLYADVREWGSKSGYVDYLCPQIYFGFNNKSQPFEQTAKDWSRLVTSKSVKLYVGLAFYKCGKTDAYAGSGNAQKNEWINNSNIISRQIRYIRGLGNCGGFMLYSYNSFLGSGINQNAKKELEAVKQIL